MKPALQLASTRKTKWSNATLVTAKSSYYISFSKDYVFKKKQVTSGASRNSHTLLQTLPLTLKVGTLFTNIKQARGRKAGKGVILCRTKGSLGKLRLRAPAVTKLFRYTSLSFVANFFSITFKFKVFSLIFSSAGQIFYSPTALNHTLFVVSKLYGINHSKMKLFLKTFSYLSKHVFIPQLFFMLFQLPKNKFISYLEIIPGKGAQYVKSSGSKATIRKLDLLMNLALVKLPSGVHKVFSIYALGSLGFYTFSDNKIKRASNAGFNSRLGRKPLSRGVAKNPVDHPHGGRAKAIKYQRTPWGKTTKYK